MITADDATEDTVMGKIVRSLQQVVDPCSIATGNPINLVDMGLVEEIRIESGAVDVRIWPTSAFCLQMPIIRDQIVSHALEIDGVNTVTCTVADDSDWMPSRMAIGARTRLRQLRPIERTGAS